MTDHLVVSPVAQLLQQAVAHHRAGGLREAERLYRGILQSQPDHAEANHNLGVLAVQVGKSLLGLPYFQTALAVNPGHGPYWLSYIDALLRAGQTDVAAQVLAAGQKRGLQGEVVAALEERLLRARSDAPSLQEMDALATLFNQGHYAQVENLAHAMTVRFPGHGFGWKTLGAALKKQGRDGESLAHLQKAVALLPGDADVHSNLGVVLKEQGRWDEAEACYRRAVALQPDADQVHCNLGNILREQGRFAEAEASYRQALAIQPEVVGYHFNLANTLKAQGRRYDAEIAYRQTLRIKPDFVEAFLNLGVVLLENGQFGAAADSFRQALAIMPDRPESLLNLGVALLELGRLAEAEAVTRRALAITPDHVAALGSLGMILREQGREEEALACFSRVVQLKPDFPQALRALGDALEARKIRDDRIIPLQTTRPTPGEGFATTMAAADFARDSPFRYPVETVLREFKQEAAAKNGLKILLIQPPIYKMAAPGAPAYPPEEGGPSQGGMKHVISGDSLQMSYGLLSIAAQVLRSGRQVLVLNLANFAWPEVEKIVRHVAADLVGISCMTFNLRGVKAFARLVAEVHPRAHIVVGGSHATALPVETLDYLQAVHSVVIGEGEQTFLEMVARLEAGQPVTGLAGSLWRDAGGIHRGAARERIRDLDGLASPHDYFSLHFLLSSRGCPFQCTFCGSFAQWGRSLKMNSVDYILQMLEKIVLEKGQRFLAIKDDTFTANRKRTLAICQGIIDRKLNFIWSCDTRVDSLDEEVLRAMRLAGCQRISLGVESGSPAILQTIHKKIDPAKVVKVTRLARKYGFQVRFYMIVGNRGETLETFRESVALIHAAQPFEFMFSPLGIKPGTEEFAILMQEKGVTADIFHDDRYGVGDYGFKDYVAADAQKDIKSWLDCYENSRGGHYYTVEESLAILDRLEGLPAAHLDVAGALLRDGQAARAEPHVRQAMEKNYPLPEHAFNYLAIIAAFGGDWPGVAGYLDLASGTGRDDPMIMENYKRFRSWSMAGEGELKLTVHNNFPAHSGYQQPQKPAPVML